MSEKVALCMVPTIRCSGKGETMEIVKTSGLGEGWDEQAEQRGLSGQ